MMRNLVERWRTLVTRLRAAWRVLRDGEPVLAAVVAVAPLQLDAPPRIDTALCVVPVGRHRVTRERPLGTIVETLFQGTGAAAGQAYERNNATEDDEWICYYRHNERCSAKPRGVQ